jgi:hypothetical protein
MPTLIRLFIILLVLAGLVFGGMVGLVAMVHPNEKEVTIRIPARDLVPAPTRDPLVVREIDTTRQAPATDTTAAPPADTTAAPAADGTAPATDAAPAQEAPTDDSDVVTLSPGVE